MSATSSSWPATTRSASATCRQRSLEEALEQSSQALHAALADSISSPSGQASRREEAVLLADALARLPEDHREVFVLRNLERASFETIAARMGRTPGAVRKLWARTLLKLASMMEGAS